MDSECQLMLVEPLTVCNHTYVTGSHYDIDSLAHSHVLVSIRPTDGLPVQVPVESSHHSLYDGTHIASLCHLPSLSLEA